jgi:hypothetical protein
LDGLQVVVAIITTSISTAGVTLNFMSYRKTHIKKLSSSIKSDLPSTKSEAPSISSADDSRRRHTSHLWYPTMLCELLMTIPVGLFLLIDALWKLNEDVAGVAAVILSFIVLFAPFATWRTIRDKRSPDGQPVPLISYFVALVISIPTAFLMFYFLGSKMIPEIGTVGP